MMRSPRLARLLTLEAGLRAVSMTNVRVGSRCNGAIWDMDDIKAKAIEFLGKKAHEAKEWLDAEG